MSSTECVQKEIGITRSELKNIRQEVFKLKASLRKEVADVKEILSKKTSEDIRQEKVKEQEVNGFNMIPIGYVSSCFKNKNGTPRQPVLCKTSKASLTIGKTYFTNPEHSLIGLSEFSYIWILFVFHKNGENSIKAKIHPPRLNGASTGVFSTRSPHRPCAIGLSLSKIEKIVGCTIFLSGIDILDGTPVLDIKPYIPSYDIPPLYREGNYFSNETAILLKDFADAQSGKESSPLKVAEDSTQINPYISDELLANKKISDSNVCSLSEMLIKPSKQLEVLFTERATKDIEKFHFPSCTTNCDYCLNFIENPSTIKQAISEVLQNDPRSVYRKNKCSDKLYFFEIDILHVTCWFDDTIAEVLRVKPVNKHSYCT